MTKKKKPKVVWVGDTPITPVTAKERQKINRQIKKRYERLRKRYPEIRGKVVDWASHYVEEGSLYVNIRFKDKTEFSISFSPEIVTDTVDLSDMKTGDTEIIREYYRRRDD